MGDPYLISQICRIELDSTLNSKIILLHIACMHALQRAKKRGVEPVLPIGLHGLGKKRGIKASA
jgi:hypothetical protein